MCVCVGERGVHYSISLHSELWRQSIVYGFINMLFVYFYVK